MMSRPQRPDRRRQRGQVMVLFGLFAIVLFAVAGLAVDAGMSYLSSDRAERAAAAAALAGVAFLPGDYPSAQNAALVEAGRNGFPNNCPSPCVTTAQPATNQLTVTITVTVQTTFLRVVGFGAHTVTRSATAEYLPPIALGQPGSAQGAVMSSTCNGVPSATQANNYCTAPTTGLGSAGNFYFMRTEGWGNPRSEGDAFTPSPNQSGTACGTGTLTCAANPPDVHLISEGAGTVTCCDSTLNYQGGENYLIMVPPHSTADVQIYDPSFAPDHNDQNGAYSYHEDDGSFPNGSTTAVDYSAMVYTVYQIPELYSRITDVKKSQEVFYPYNATGLYGVTGANYATRSYYYFPYGGSGTATTVTGDTPDTYHQWVSALNYTPGDSNDVALETNPTPISTACKCLNNTTGSVQYYRLEVDNVAWNGTPPCTSACTGPTTTSAAWSKAHKGYAVQLGGACLTASPACTVSAMSDMTVYTPINAGSSSAQFSIPLFALDQSYAGKQITVDIFDPGDVGGGPAYMALEEPVSASTDPSGYTWAATPSTFPTVELGTSLGTGGKTPVPKLNNWPGVTGGTWPSTTPCGACYQSAGSGGGSLYNGEWLQWTIQVPNNFTGAVAAHYWNLVYDVSAGTRAGDTFSVQVGYNGTPDHLLP